MFMILAMVLFLVGFGASLIVIIDAFKKLGALHGILCFCFFPYLLYYGFAKFENPKKNLILGAIIGCYLLGYVFNYLGAKAAVDAAMEAAQQAGAPAAE